MSYAESNVFLVHRDTSTPRLPPYPTTKQSHVLCSEYFFVIVWRRLALAALFGTQTKIFKMFFIYKLLLVNYKIVNKNIYVIYWAGSPGEGGTHTQKRARSQAGAGAPAPEGARVP
jgi:hypothetical protein